MRIRFGSQGASPGSKGALRLLTLQTKRRCGSHATPLTFVPHQNFDRSGVKSLGIQIVDDDLERGLHSTADGTQKPRRCSRLQMTCFCKSPYAVLAAAVPSTKGGVAPSIRIGLCRPTFFADRGLDPMRVSSYSCAAVSSRRCADVGPTSAMSRLEHPVHEHHITLLDLAHLQRGVLRLLPRSQHVQAFLTLQQLNVPSEPITASAARGGSRCPTSKHSVNPAGLAEQRMA